MRQVQIYIYNTQKSPKRLNGRGCYILEIDTPKGEITKTRIAQVQQMTANEAEQIILINALEYLNKLNIAFHMIIYTDSQYVASGVMKWMDGWQRNGWKNAKGEKIVNFTQWQRLFEALNKYGNEYEFRVKKHHPYSSWFQTNVR